MHPTRYGSKFPDFMEWNGLTELPAFMVPLISTPFAVGCALSIPTLLAFIFGVITFKRHIYGVYCAVITLAESLILQEFIIEYQAYTGGFNGITDYSNYVDAPVPVVHPGGHGRVLPDRRAAHPFARSARC